MNAQLRSMQLLLVEDNKADIVLTRRAFKKSKFDFDLHIARDSAQALHMLNKTGDHEDTPAIDLILLDLNLPEKSGIDVIIDIKKSPDLMHIPVIMLSSSKTQIDAIKNRNLKANSYIVKPNNEQQYAEIVKAIETCWFNALSKAS
jgi:CheY-like chemotaxis protein